MKVIAKETSYMEEGRDKGRPWIIKGKIYDLIGDCGDDQMFKSEITDTHWISYEDLDDYFESVVY